MGKRTISKSELTFPKRKIKNDLSGKTIGEWKVIQYAGSKNGRWYLCRCSCGFENIIHGGAIRRGNSNSCGHKGSTFIHGFAKRGRVFPEYFVWRSMQYRCEREWIEGYEYYGGRGIKVCERWRTFSNFLEDMGRRPTSRHTIERLNNATDYMPSNCEWALPHAQSRNKRNNHNVTINGITLCVTDWAKRLKTTPKTFLKRLSK
jgi:hypothetical protein